MPVGIVTNVYYITKLFGRSDMLTGDLTVSDMISDLRGTNDETVKKYVVRLRQKLKQS